MKLVSDRRVPHSGPEDAEIMFIGEAPGRDDDTLQVAFSGPSGDLLDSLLSSIDLTREQVRLGNVLNYQPAKNDFSKAHETWQLAESRKELTAYLKSHTHKILVPMGRRAIEFLLGYDSIEKHRSSVYRAHNAWVIPTNHPYSVLKDGTLSPATLIDFQKIKKVLTHGWTEPRFNFIIGPAYDQLEALLPTILAAPRLFCDIETKMHTAFIRCMGFAWSDKDAVCIFNDGRYDGDRMGSNFRRVLEKILSSPIPKTFHNGMFDTLILSENGINVENWNYDTMIAQHVLQAQLPLGLDYCTSIYTDINYYKDDGKESSDRIDRTRLGIYNCKDVVATALVQAGQEKELSESQRAYLQYKMTQCPLALEFSRTGLLVDTGRRDELQERVSLLRSQDYLLFGHLVKHFDAELFLVSQHKKVADFLFKTLKLPIKTTQEGTVTTGEDAIVELLAHVEMKIQSLKTEEGKEPWRFKKAILKLILSIRGHDKLLSSYINVETSLDGRVRSTYKFWGAETGRWSAGKWYDDTGLNGQTIPRESV